MKTLAQLKVRVPTWMNFTFMNFTFMPALTLAYISSKTILLFQITGCSAGFIYTVSTEHKQGSSPDYFDRTNMRAMKFLDYV